MKLEIKQAIDEKIFDVKVASVNTINRQGKRKRTTFRLGRSQEHQACDCDPQEGTIDVFGGPQA